MIPFSRDFRNFPSIDFRIELAFEVLRIAEMVLCSRLNGLVEMISGAGVGRVLRRV